MNGWVLTLYVGVVSISTKTVAIKKGIAKKGYTQNIFSKNGGPADSLMHRESSYL